MPHLKKPVSDLSCITNDSNLLIFREKLRRICHWGPIIALMIIFVITFASIRSSILLTPPTRSLTGAAQLSGITISLYLILNSFFRALCTGPGFVPLGWIPSDPEVKSKLQFCQLCNGYKPPRAHHCRSCKRCVMKMDHHCPWINTCCGHLNHGYFLHFLLSVPMGCGLCTVILGLATYQYWRILPYAFASRLPNAFTEVMMELCISIFGFGLAVGVFIAVGALAVFQLISLQRNETGIETWIIAKAKHRRKRSPNEEKPFVYPYNLGRWKNLTSVLSWSGHPQGDGIHWPIRPGSGEYDFTLEQLRQKQLKDSMRKDFQVRRDYNGRYCPCWQFGCRVALDTPYPDETRLVVKAGDHLTVTRWSKQWIYGDLHLPNKPAVNGHAPTISVNPRGWIPRICAREVPP